MSQPDLAEASGVSLSMVRKVEQERSRTPGFWPVAQMGAALGVSLAELLGEPSEEKPQAPEPQPPARSDRLTVEADESGVFQGYPRGAVLTVTGEIIVAKDREVHMTVMDVKSTRRRRKQ